jgi:hypothetical protein
MRTQLGCATNDDDAPPAVKEFHELTALLLLTETPEARAVLTEFLRVCEHLTQEQLAEVLAIFGA